MKYYGKEIYCSRGETFALDCSIVDQDDKPFRISSELSNPHLLLTISSSAYSQKNRYLLRNWINLADFPKVNNMLIPELAVDPIADDLLRYQVFYNTTEKKFKIYDEKELKYVEYDFNLVHTFHSEITKNWIEQTYEYSIHLVSGTLSEAYTELLNNDLLGESVVPFSKIECDFEIVPKTKIYVSSNQNGGDYIE